MIILDYSIIIFRKIGNDKWSNVIDYHASLFIDRKKLLIQKDDSHWGIVNDTKLHPATKEQRDLLFQKMHVAGYEWNDEKKELKKINSYCQEHCKGYQETGRCFVDGGCQAKKSAESTWSEEDEKHIHHISDFIMRNRVGDTDAIYRLEQDVVWLKSLKERIGE